MRINVAQLLKEPAGTQRSHDLSEDIRGIDDDLQVQDLLVGRVRMLRTAAGILVTATLKTAVRLECCRCLEPVCVPIELQIEEEFHPSVDIHTGAKLPLMESEEDATIIDEQHILDLAEIVRQTIFVALPMHPLCREDCAGLCAQCGQNLNEAQCDCVSQTADPRLEILKELL